MVEMGRACGYRSRAKSWSKIIKRVTEQLAKKEVGCGMTSYHVFEISKSQSVGFNVVLIQVQLGI